MSIVEYLLILLYRYMKSILEAKDCRSRCKKVVVLVV